jgi:hypothetical protein
MPRQRYFAKQAEGSLKCTAVEKVIEPPVENSGPKEWSEALPSIRQWSTELSERAQGHRKNARRWRNLNRFLGALNVLLAAVSATAMYAALNKKLPDLSITWQVIITGFTVLPAISVGLQKEWQVLAREHGHLALAQDCRILLKELDFYIAFPPANVRDTLTSWHQRYREVICRPTIPARP